MSQRPNITITLNGGFALRCDVDDVQAPRSTKAKAVLALILTSPQGQRGRLWLQDKLWSDRGPEQGAASLRQALTDIRRSFGPARGYLVANKSSVALDLGQITLDDKAKGEFLEGIDVRDPEFEDWLALQRSEQSNYASDAAGPALASRGHPTSSARLFFEIEGDSTSAMGLMSTMFVDTLCLTLRETMMIDTARLTSGTQPNPNDVVVVVQAAQSGPQEAVLRLSLESLPDRQIYWSDHETATLGGAPPVHDLKLLSLGNRLIQALSETLRPQERGEAHHRDALLIGQMAVRKLFTMGASQMQEADQLLSQAHAIDPNGLFLAWRAQLRLMQLVERHEVDAATLLDEIDAYSAQALESDPRNSMVLSIASSTRLFLDRDANASLALAQRSVDINGANPLAWNALSISQLYMEETEQAHLSAVKAQVLGKGSPYEFWWDMGRSMTAILTNRTEEATRLLNQSTAFSPNFRAPLRYLAGLNAATDNDQAAHAAADRLRRQEKDFTFAKLTEDENYPTGLLRLQSPAVRKKIAKFK